MEILNEFYNKSTAENEKNLRFWNNYLQELKSLNFNTYSEKLKVPVLVPIGSRILFRGEVKHTNEVTVALGADYFVKCSLAQADILRQHRINVAQEKVDEYNKEKEYLDNHLSFTKQNVYDDHGKEIIEYHTEEEDKVWRSKHVENVKEYMQRRAKEKEHKDPDNDITDTELWERLEELELQEELENELNDMNNEAIMQPGISKIKNDSLVVKEENYSNLSDTERELDNEKKDEVKLQKEIKNKFVTYTESKGAEQPSKLDLLQQVIDRQNELDEKLHELKNRERSQSKTENDLMSRLDELEQLDELEDEMDRLDDIIENEDIEESEEEVSSKSNAAKLQRRVSFVDEDDSETLNLTFKHSDVKPNNEPYNPEKGIQKPSDIYQIHSNLFGNGVTSILKKSKYTKDVEVPQIVSRKPENKVLKERSSCLPVAETYDHVVPKTIVIKDVVENVAPDDNKEQTEIKPMSLFKKKRMQNKS